MRLYYAAGACLLYAGLIGCARGAEEPTGPTLSGRWGSPDRDPIMLTADSAATVITIGCSHIYTRDAVALAEDGKFTFRGLYVPSGPPNSSPKPKADVSGVIQGDVVDLVYDVLGDDRLAQHVSLRSGVEPPFDFACLL